MPEARLNPYQSPSTPEGPLVPHGVDPQLLPVATGLRFIYRGILLVLFSLIIGFPALAFTGNSGLFAILIGMLGVLGIILVNLGPLFCMTAPLGSGLRPTAIATVILQSACIGLAVFQAANVLAYPWYAIGSGVFAICASTTFLIFMHRTARYINRIDLVTRTRNVFLIGAAVLTATLAVGFIVDTDDPGSIGLIAVVICIFSYALLFVAYANVVNAISDSIRHPDKKKKQIGLA